MGHVVNAARGPGMAAKNSPGAECAPTNDPVLLDCLKCVARTGRVVTTDVAVERRDDGAVRAQHNNGTVSRQQSQEGGRLPDRRSLGHLTSAPFKHVENFTLQGSPRNPLRSWQRTNDEVAPGRPSEHNIVPDRSKAAGDQVARDRVTDRLGNDEAQARRRRVVGARDVDERMRSCDTATLPHRGAKVVPRHNPIRPFEHEGTTQSDYAESSVRPLRRRAARMERPARVRIRRRNPCTFARRRLFGWKVLLLIAVSPMAQLCM
jgi:hypothetical protein